jgi:Xaa-Pro aminopeptidase
MAVRERERVGRLARLRERLEEPLLVTTPANVRWLTGLESSNAAVLVEPHEATLFADFRYASAAHSVLERGEGIDFVETRRALLRDLSGRLDGRIGFEASHVSYAGWETLRAGGAELAPTYDVVEGLRAVKSPDELDAIRRATAIADQALQELLDEPWLGRTDRELALRLEQLMVMRGGEGAAFDSIVGAGPVGANPHGRPEGVVLEPGALVVVDWGCIVDGYCSDCTRTFSTGDLPDELEQIYEVCLGAQQRAVNGIKAGLSGVDADLLARQPIEDAGYGAQFGHGLGHGVGLMVHEGPRLSQESNDVLEPGNVVTIEPGIYLERNAGVRIEDLAVVTEEGLELFTKLSKELQTLS